MKRLYLFDLGGVIFHLNYQLTYQAFEKLTGLSSQEFFHQLKQPTLFDEFERGEINQKYFLEQFRQKFIPSKVQSSITDEQIISAWNAMLIGIPNDNLIFLEQLAQKNDLYLLSNTNTIHWDEVKNILIKNSQWKRFEQCFKKLFLSFEIKSRKPEIACYQHCINQLRVAPSHLHFLDDNIDNINAALKLGIKATHYTHNQLLKSSKDFTL